MRKWDADLSFPSRIFAISFMTVILLVNPTPLCSRPLSLRVVHFFLFFSSSSLFDSARVYMDPFLLSPNPALVRGLFSLLGTSPILLCTPGDVPIQISYALATLVFFDSTRFSGPPSHMISMPPPCLLKGDLSRGPPPLYVRLRATHVLSAVIGFSFCFPPILLYRHRPSFCEIQFSPIALLRSQIRFQRGETFLFCSRWFCSD